MSEQRRARRRASREAQKKKSATNGKKTVWWQNLSDAAQGRLSWWVRLIGIMGLGFVLVRAWVGVPPQHPNVYSLPFFQNPYNYYAILGFLWVVLGFVNWVIKRNRYGKRF